MRVLFFESILSVRVRILGEPAEKEYDFWELLLYPQRTGKTTPFIGKRQMATCHGHTDCPSGRMKDSKLVWRASPFRMCAFYYS